MVDVLYSVARFQENLNILGDKLESPRDELLQAKKDEGERTEKIENLCREIEVMHKLVYKKI